MLPSVVSFFYFMMFFGILVYWSLHLAFNPKTYGILKMVIYTYLALHMILLYICQLSFFQTWLADNDNEFHVRSV